jgi:hypothetical protein
MTAPFTIIVVAQVEMATHETRVPTIVHLYGVSPKIMPPQSVALLRNVTS